LYGFIVPPPPPEPPLAPLRFGDAASEPPPPPPAEVIVVKPVPEIEEFEPLFPTNSSCYIASTTISNCYCNYC
jgi:hypothetical protein